MNGAIICETQQRIYTGKECGGLCQERPDEPRTTQRLCLLLNSEIEVITLSDSKKTGRIKITAHYQYESEAQHVKNSVGKNE